MKLGSTQNLKNGRLGQGNLGISFEVGDHNYCRIPPKRIGCSSRLEISKQFGLLRVDAESPNFSESLPNKGFPDMDLFASRPSHQTPTYAAWKPDPHSHATDAFQQNWAHKFLYAFPPFCMIPKVLNKTLKEKVPKLVLITPAWSTQVWYPKILNMSIKSPILLPRRKDILKIPKWKI